jgi:hypothetical protein
MPIQQNRNKFVLVAALAGLLSANFFGPSNLNAINASSLNNADQSAASPILQVANFTTDEATTWNSWINTAHSDVATVPNYQIPFVVNSAGKVQGFPKTTPGSDLDKLVISFGILTNSLNQNQDNPSEAKANNASLLALISTVSPGKIQASFVMPVSQDYHFKDGSGNEAVVQQGGIWFPDISTKTGNGYALSFVDKGHRVGGDKDFATTFIMTPKIASILDTKKIAHAPVGTMVPGAATPLNLGTSNMVVSIWASQKAVYFYGDNGALTSQISTDVFPVALQPDSTRILAKNELSPGMAHGFKMKTAGGNIVNVQTQLPVQEFTFDPKVVDSLVVKLSSIGMTDSPAVFRIYDSVPNETDANAIARKMGTTQRGGWAEHDGIHFTYILGTPKVVNGINEIDIALSMKFFTDFNRSYYVYQTPPLQDEILYIRHFESIAFGAWFNAENGGAMEGANVAKFLTESQGVLNPGFMTITFDKSLVPTGPNYPRSSTP